MRARQIGIQRGDRLTLFGRFDEFRHAFAEGKLGKYQCRNQSVQSDLVDRVALFRADAGA